jgi:hypothetical protein
VDLVDSVRGILSDHGTDCYVDREDSEMPNPPSKKTARRLKEKMEICDKFIMIASEKALESPWVPWELGFADCSRSSTNVAIFPVEEDSGTWKGREYLRLYGLIEEKPADSGSWFVCPTRIFHIFDVGLSEWLRR